MPRPGPRPYECIRRAWHSDSHQALRGSLTQEIFRIVKEIHSAETRTKKEWQEKLPIVVLRAEEILYSKARTEAEYTDVSTLKTRLEDAVNTMIRRTDENKEKEEEESGVFMEPCVEAALSLGCLPKMNPRGQRSSTSRMSGSSSLRRTIVPSTTPSGSPSPTSSTVTQSPSAFLTMAPRPFVPPVQVQVSSVPGMLEPPRMNGPPCYSTTSGVEHQHVQPPQQLKYATTPFGLEAPHAQLSSSFMLRDQGSLPASLICMEDFHPRPGALAGVMGNIYANPRYEHGGNINAMPPILSGTSNVQSSSWPAGVTPMREHDFLELSLGPPKGFGAARSSKAGTAQGEAAGGLGGGGGGHAEMQSSSSSSGSMSWQSEGVRECSKRKGLPWPLGGTTGEVAKRQKDFLF